jgi:hypothetical protein
MSEMLIPIDGILPKILKSESFVLGVGSNSTLTHEVWDRLVSSLATNCSVSSGRKSMLIRFEEKLQADHPSEESSERPSLNVECQVAKWAFPGESKPEKTRWYQQLAHLVHWRQEYGFILLDLGDFRHDKVIRTARICDAVVLQMLQSGDKREAARMLKLVQAERLPLLGVWSLAA